MVVLKKQYLEADMTVQLYMTQMEKLAKALLYLVLLLCLPDTSVYTISTQKQAADHIRTEIGFSHAQPASKTISYLQELAKLRKSGSLSADYRPTLTQLSLLHDRDFKITFAHISKQNFGYTSRPYLYQLKTIPQSSDDLPPHLSRG